MTIFLFEILIFFLIFPFCVFEFASFPFLPFSSLVTQSLNPWSLAHRLSNISWLILMEVKSKAWKSILTSTATGSYVNITINRPRALKARERGNDPDGLKSVFGQTFQQLHFLRPAQLRVRAGERPFRVKFAGEGGIDAGGEYIQRQGGAILGFVLSILLTRPFFGLFFSFV